MLFGVIFFWTPPHFWALAMRFRDDYAAAGVPMLPVVAAAAVARARSCLYSYAMVAATLVLAPYAALAVRLVRGRARRLVPGRGAPAAAGRHVAGARRPAPMRLFHLSIAYLSLLFAAVAVTALLPWGHW